MGFGMLLQLNMLEHLPIYHKYQTKIKLPSHDIAFTLVVYLQHADLLHVQIFTKVCTYIYCKKHRSQNGTLWDAACLGEGY